MNALARASAAIEILIVEDESIIAFNLQETLEALEYSVCAIAVSGQQAIQQAADLRPDLVLMDIRIKGDMDGIQTAEQIWERFQIPVIFVTGHSDKRTVERAKLTAPFGYLLKPIKERELYVAIESALQRCERERWISTVLQGIGDAVIVVDLEGQVRFLNAVAEAITGWQLQEARSRSVLEVFHVVDEETRSPVASPIETALEQRIVVRLEGNFLLIARNGTSVPIADSIAPLIDNAGELTGVVIVFRDITARRQAEERNLAIDRANQLQQQMSELERLSQLKDDFLNTVSHELRTPISNIKMAIQMLELVLGQQGLLVPGQNSSSQSLERYLSILRSQCDQELFLVNDLLDLQRLNAEVYGLEFTPIVLSDWIPHIVESFEDRAQDRQLNLQVDLKPQLPLFVSDQPSLNRILLELLNNACKYTPSGEQITLVVRSEVQERGESSQKQTTVIISVCNSGVEIPPEELPRIFDPFYRIPRSDRWGQGGTGLGLALVKKLVICLSGSIRAESHSGQTCFVVELPAQPNV